ncbi:MAG: hypothetical protein DWI59_02560 [Chloroflexi bacterium]|nr:MAG: hypothetical protein DWI59_02560 [Chloroflexota bacterium]
MRLRDRWPLLVGLGAGVAVLATAAAWDIGARSGWRSAERLLGVDAAGWALALLVVTLALAVQLARDGQLALLRERRLVHTAAALREASARLEVQATTDALTGLFNRRVFEDRLRIEYGRAMRYGRPLHGGHRPVQACQR